MRPGGCMLAALLLGALASTAPTASVASAQPALEDFAVAFEVAPQLDPATASTAIVEVSADASMHAEAISGRLDDLRVFDARGEVVPHAIVWPRPADPVREVVPFFLLPAIKDNERDLRVEIAESGAIISVERTAAATPAATIWLLDLTALAGRVLGFDFDWSRADGDLLAPLQFEGSNDLATWTRLPDTGALVGLSSEIGVLQRSEIAVAAGAYDYLRISSTAAALPELRAVRAMLAPPSAARARWWPISGRAVTEASGTRWRYDLPGRVAIDALRPDPESKPLFFSASVSAVRDDNAPRRIGDVLVRERTIALLRVAEADALLVEPGAGAPDAPVPLEIRVMPARVRFAATGPGPFSIAIGLVGLVAPSGPAVAALLDETVDARVVQADAGPMRIVAGDAARQAQTPSDLPFWLALLAGLAVLGLMVRRLVAELGDKSDAGHS